MGIFILPIKLLTSKLGLIVLLLVGIVVGVYLIQNTTIFRSRASVNVSRAFEIKDANGNEVSCNGDTCYVDTDTVNIKLRDITALEEQN